MADEIVDNKKSSNWFSKDLLSLRKPSKVYIVEFLIMHVALLGVITSGIGLFNKILDESIEKTSSGIDVFSLAGLEFTLWLVAVGLVSTLLFLTLQARTTKSEQTSPALTMSRRRRLLQYVFLSVTSLVLINYVIAFVYSLLVEFFGEVQDGSDALWRILLKQIFAIGFIGVISYYVAHNVEPRGEEK